MAGTSSSSSTSNYQTAWGRALKHLDDLPPEKQKYFLRLTQDEKDILRQNTSPDEILQLLKTTGAIKRSRLSWFNDKLAKPFAQFQGIFEATATACSGIGAPIWAPIKVIIQLAMSMADEASKIDGFLQDMLGKLKLFQEIESHFKPSPRKSWDLLYSALTNFYISVIDFTLVTAKHYRSNISKHMLRRLWRTFDGDFGDIISNMKRHLESVAPAVQLAAMKASTQHYEDLSSMLKSEADLAKTETEVNAAIRLDERQRAVQLWLSGTGMDADQEKHQSNILQDTCDWFFETPTFHNWFDTKNSATLGVLGIPGCGKSVLCSSLIHRLQTHLAPRDPVLYFFCKKGDEKRNNPSSILRSIILQFLKHPIHGTYFVAIIHDLMSRGISASDYSIQSLWQLLKKMMDKVETTYLVIDGLDECSGDGKLKEFLELLAALETSNTEGIKILASCRPNELQIPWPAIFLEESDVSGDITSYIDNRIEKSTVKPPQLREKVRLAIRHGAGGTFLWAKLMLDTIENSSPWEIEEVLKDIPKELSDVYDLMLQRVSNLEARSVKRCQKVLHWCIAASHLLTVDELLMALAVSENIASQEDYDLGSDRTGLLRLIQHECGSLVTVRNDNCVQLVHTSLQEYLLRDEPQRKESSLLSIVDLKQVHIDLARICLRYNQFSCFQTEVDHSELADFESRYPFSRYSTTSWILHVTESGISDSKISNDIIEFFSSPQAPLWLMRCDVFGLSEGHLLVLQGKLRAWMERQEHEKIRSSDSVMICSFVLQLRNIYYVETCRDSGDSDQRSIFAAFALGSACNEHGKYQEALVWYMRALAGQEIALGTEHPSIFTTTGRIAAVYSKQGQYDEALVWNRRALAWQEIALGTEHPSTLLTVRNIASVYYRQGQYDEALAWYRRALAGQEVALGKQHPSTLKTVNGVGNVYSQQGQYDEALAWYRMVVAGQEIALGKEHPSTLATVGNIANVYSDQGQYDEALAWYRRALAGQEIALGKEHPSTLAAVCGIANVYHQQGQYDEALAWYRRALAGQEIALGKEHPSTLAAVCGIANFYSRQGQYDEALAWHRRALAGEEIALGKEHPSTLATVGNIANVYSRQGQYDESLAWHRRALAGQEVALGKEHPSTLATVGNIANVYYCQGQYDEALAWYRRTLAGQEIALGKEHPDTLRTVSNIANTYRTQGLDDEALVWSERALAGQETTPGSSSIHEH